MICLATEPLLVRDHNGRLVDFEASELETTLAELFRELAVSGVWMAEDITATIEDKIRSCTATPPARTDMERLVVTLLQTLGFPDVAQLYEQRLPPAPLPEEDMRPWDRPTLTRILEEHLPLVPTQCCRLAERCEAALLRMDLQEVSERFVISLAIHLLRNGASHADTSTAAPSFWRARLSSEARTALSSGVLRLLPLNNIFPVARLNVNLPRLVELHCGGWLSLLSLPTAVQTAVPLAVEILTKIREDLAKSNPFMADGIPSLRIPHLETTLTELGTTSPEEQKEIRRLLVFLLQQETAKAPFPIQLIL